MRIAGWADTTAAAQQSRVKALPEVQTALADQRAMLRAAVLTQYPIADIAKRRVELAKQDESASTALTATDRLLEDIGIRDAQDQSRLTENVLMALLPLILPHVPADRQSALLTDLEAVRSNRPVIDVTPEPIKAPQPVAVTVTPPTPPVVFQTNAQREDNH